MIVWRIKGKIIGTVQCCIMSVCFVLSVPVNAVAVLNIVNIVGSGSNAG